MVLVEEFVTAEVIEKEEAAGAVKFNFVDEGEVPHNSNPNLNTSKCIFLNNFCSISFWL